MTHKYCVDCKYHAEKPFKVFSIDYNAKPICTRLESRDLVTGNLTTNNALDCYAEREDALRLEQFRCGVNGEYFKSKYIADD